MELEAIPVFVKVAQLGSFTAAAKSLGMPNTTVSAKVAQLERHLGVTLIQRTTRKLHLTDIGRAYLDRCVKALAELQTAESELQSNTQEIKGPLRVTASIDVGQSILASLVDRYVKKHPKVEVELLITNRIVDLIGEGVDIAIRSGNMKDSSLMAKKFVDVRFSLWASKSYLKKNGTPKKIEELASHRFVKFTTLNSSSRSFTNGERTFQLEMKASIQADDFGTVKALVDLGNGIAMFPDFYCETVADERLVRVLPEWTSPAGHFALVYPAQKFINPKVRAFIDMARQDT